MSRYFLVLRLGNLPEKPNKKAPRDFSPALFEFYENA